MKLEIKLTNLWADHVLSRFIDLSKYDNNPELANKHYKRFEVTSFITLSLSVLILGWWSNIFIVVILLFIITFFNLVSFITFKRIMFEKNLLEMTERKKELYRLQLNDSIAFFMSLVMIVLIAIEFLVKL